VDSVFQSLKLLSGIEYKAARSIAPSEAPAPAHVPAPRPARPFSVPAALYSLTNVWARLSSEINEYRPVKDIYSQRLDFEAMLPGVSEELRAEVVDSVFQSLKLLSGIEYKAARSIAPSEGRETPATDPTPTRSTPYHDHAEGPPISTGELRERLAAAGVDSSDCLEKGEMVALAHRHGVDLTAPFAVSRDIPPSSPSQHPNANHPSSRGGSRHADDHVPARARDDDPVGSSRRHKRPRETDATDAAPDPAARRDRHQRTRDTDSAHAAPTASGAAFPTRTADSDGNVPGRWVCKQCGEAVLTCEDLETMSPCLGPIDSFTERSLDPRVHSTRNRLAALDLPQGFERRRLCRARIGKTLKLLSPHPSSSGNTTCSGTVLEKVAPHGSRSSHTHRPSAPAPVPPEVHSRPAPTAPNSHNPHHAQPQSLTTPTPGVPVVPVLLAFQSRIYPLRCRPTDKIQVLHDGIRSLHPTLHRVDLFQDTSLMQAQMLRLDRTVAQCMEHSVIRPLVIHVRASFDDVHKPR